MALAATPARWRVMMRRLLVNWRHALLATLIGGLGAFIALHHPLAPVLLICVLAAWSLAVFMRPAIWPFALPALLPVAGFAPWTGWLGLEEFDVLVLGAAAGAHARLAIGAAREGQTSRWARICLGLMALSWLLALLRGLLDAGSFRLDWFQAYEDPLNSLRTAKSFLFVLLLLPPLRHLLEREPERLAGGLATGVATGLGLVSLAIVGERAGYPGLLDFSTPYRATALFWEMHVGGAGLDAFLVLAVPFAACMVLRAPTALHWLLAALLAVVTGYACLTTFSRGVYLGVAVALSALAWRLSMARRLPLVPSPTGQAAPNALLPAPEPWRVWGGRALLLVLILEGVAVLGIGDFMSRRLSASERDLGGRLLHWREGLSLLRGPSDLLLGMGLGRFPANYSQTVPGREMPGRLRIVGEGDSRHLLVFGARDKARPGAFELLQRVSTGGGVYSVAVDVRAPGAAGLGIGVCRRHLLRDAACLRMGFLVADASGDWRHVTASFTTPPGARGLSQRVGLGFLVLRLEGQGDLIEIDNLSLRDAAGNELLRNGNFSGGLAHWFFGVRHDYLPWHIDNLFLEALIDQGAIGLLLLLGIMTLAFSNLLRGPGREHVLAPYLIAALAGGAAVGAFSSILDMPRSAFLFFLLLCCALFLDGRARTDPPSLGPSPERTPKGAPRSIMIA